eukprot:TRINITY_DN61_c0_g1_i1.p1 TRINITY_DN61_c0_g1~~TRINITY_DN61_c0_g1_i1.p1  ORF type:complete len:129 (+),score=14.73 TRINITY_DN61_c0_g1_i1:115-501(+)
MSSQPVPPQHQYVPDFQTSLFGCLADPLGCCKTLICMPCVMANNSAKLDGYPGGAPFLCCYPCSSVKSRMQCRSKFLIKQDFVGDCLVGCFCPCCSECQVQREITDVDAHKGSENAYAWTAPQQQTAA